MCAIDISFRFFLSKCMVMQLCSCLFLPIKGCRLDRRFTCVAQFLLPPWVDLVSIFLEGKDAPLISLWVLAYSTTPSDSETSPYVPAFHNFQASSPCLHDMAPCFGPSLWPNDPPPAVNMTLECPRFSKNAGSLSAFMPPEMIGVVWIIPSHSCL